MAEKTSPCRPPISICCGSWPPTPGRLWTATPLLKNLRGVTYDGMDRSVDVAISRLRKKLLDNATEPYRIKTVRNKGYLFAPHAWDN
ncbi:DNA-binding transcriptional regulator RstA [Klebsiella pneumoniae]|nr:DNA-binding transcriptional regulator RstA [Klebsiella pneumoniae]